MLAVMPVKSGLRSYGGLPSARRFRVPKEGRLLCRVPLQGHNYLILLVLRRTSNHSPNPSPIIGKGLNRSSCRSYINVSSTHQRVGMFLSTTLNAGRLCERQLGPSARSLIAYMSGASLKKGPAWFLSTTLNAGRLYERSES